MIQLLADIFLSKSSKQNPPTGAWPSTVLIYHYSRESVLVMVCASNTQHFWTANMAWQSVSWLPNWWWFELQLTTEEYLRKPTISHGLEYQSISSFNLFLNFPDLFRLLTDGLNLITPSKTNYVCPGVFLSQTVSDCTYTIFIYFNSLSVQAAQSIPELLPSKGASSFKTLSTLNWNFKKLNKVIITTWGNAGGLLWIGTHKFMPSLIRAAKVN